MKAGDSVISLPNASVGIITRIIKDKFKVKVGYKNIWHDREEIRKLD